jgi:hypothetical protein
VRHIAADTNPQPAALSLIVVAMLTASMAHAAESDALIVSAKFGQSRTTMWSPTLEWTIDNDSYEANPFDLVAKVTFTHDSGEKKHVTEMFYAGEDTWKFRFTGTRTGKWTLTTQADGKNGTTKDNDLHGRSGQIIVSKHPDPKMRGFITHRGNKFARQVGGPDDLEGFLPDTYMNQRKYGNPEGYGWTDITPTLTDPKVYEAYMDEVEAHGCNGVFVHVINQWLKAHALSYDDHDSVNPDFETFAALENAIVRAHQRGLYVHLWAWGDEARKWTPKGLPGGVNGKVDRRVQRYIAARLGPLPGWVMGYGFDLQEWTDEQDLGSWAKYLHERAGWHHMLWARGRSDEALDARSYSGYGVESYDQIVEKLESDPDRPHLFEERDTYLRSRGGLTQHGSRRFMWRQAIAGGMMGFWGHYPRSYYDKGPYPHPEQFVCCGTFWDGRFLLDMQRAGDLTDGHALATPDHKHLVFYQEDTDRITMNLTGAPGPLPVIAVDTTRPYREIKVGTLKPGKHAWQAPRKSDWAIAVGHFSAEDD